MLVEVVDKTYQKKFPKSPHPYISESFIENVKFKAGQVVRLIEENKKVSIGLIAGIKDGVLLSPFSAPFGGFHFTHDNVFTSEIDQFVVKLINYAYQRNIKMIKLTLPPDIYHQSFNSKMSNSLLRNGFYHEIPEIINWIDLKQFNGTFSSRSARKNLNTSLRCKLSFHIAQEIKEKELAYQIIIENRVKFGRPIYMVFADLLHVSELWPVDFFLIKNKDQEAVAAAIFYRGHEKIVQGVFWADTDQGRSYRAMDFLAWNLWNHYKKLNYNCIDLGRSSTYGIPNNGLIRFKEDIGCTSALRLTFKWNHKNN